MTGTGIFAQEKYIFKKTRKCFWIFCLRRKARLVKGKENVSGFFLTRKGYI